MVNRLHAQPCSPAELDHGEGPVWDERTQSLRCVDLLAGDLVDVEAAGGLSRRHVGPVAAAWRPRSRGGMVVAVERGFTLLDADGSSNPLGDLWDDATVRMNDGGCDPQGRFYCGSMGYDARPGAGALWLLTPDLEARPVLTDVTISNGLAWAPGGQHAYYVDTPTRRIDVLRFGSDGDVVAREPLVEVAAGAGDPDGLTVDAEGYVWVALWDGAAVHRYSPDGEVDTVVHVATPRPTACTFGGPGLQRLYVTTSRTGLEAPDERAGAVFAVDVDVPGLPVLPFGG